MSDGVHTFPEYGFIFAAAYRAEGTGILQVSGAGDMDEMKTIHETGAAGGTNTGRSEASAVTAVLNGLTERYAVLKCERDAVLGAYELIRDSYEAGGKLLIAGNGGSAADSEHIVGELMKGFRKRRPVGDQLAGRLKTAGALVSGYNGGMSLGDELAGKLQLGLPAIALSGHEALTTAYLNDVDGRLTFAQQTLGYGRSGDVLLAISTSGNSENILAAAVTAKALDMKVIGLTGRDGGRLKALSDVCIVVPEQETYKIQELHLPVYHALCLMLEEHFFTE